MEILKMKTSQRDYNIYIGDKAVLEKLSPYLEKYDSVLLLSNSTVGPLYAEKLLKSFSENIQKKNIHSFYMEDGEEFKNFETANKIFDFMLKNNFFRNSVILTLGGGVVCDMGGFVASTYMRGIDFIQIPTSLLAQVDASIGGKVAINHGSYKNSIGAFHQPQAVFVNTTFLQSLSSDQFASGMGEVIKHSLISKDDQFLKFLKEKNREILSLNSGTLSSMILSSCRIKKDIVERDEHERGERAFLNLGHTYGHALEAAYDFRNITHGEAVAKGIIFELQLAENYSSIAAGDILDSLKTLFHIYNLDCEPVKLKDDTLLKHMMKDKKNSTLGISFVIFQDFGKFSSKIIPKDIISEINRGFKNNLVKAVIDIGTNSTRLLIAEAEYLPQEKIFSVKRNLLELVEITQLGKGVDRNRILHEDSMNITLETIKKFRNLALEYGAVTIKGFATSAVRDAGNRQDFLNRAEALGIEVQCITGKEEAQLSFIANSSLFPGENIFLLDIGGGSTEFTLGNSERVIFQESFDVGAVRISEIFFQDENYTSKNIDSAKLWIRENLKKLSQFKNHKFNLVGVAATVTTQATVQEKMEIYDSSKLHLYRLSKDMVKSNLKLFISLSGEERKKLIGLEPKRSEVIVGGTLILLEIMEILECNSLTLSEVDNLEGGIMLY
ncbi:MAG: 3-dehydroquinate synthase [Fusobacteriaceae bacterium]